MGMINPDPMQNPMNNQLAMQGMNFYGASNPGIYQNQQRLGNDGNLNGQQITTGSNQNYNNSHFSEGNGTSYKQFIKNNNNHNSTTSKGLSQQLGESNNSQNSAPGGGHHNHAATVSQFKNKKIIVKHSNIVKKKRQIKIWTIDEDELLKHLYEQQPGKWNEIAVQIPGRNASQCSQRWRRILPTKIRKPWTNEEDLKVLELSNKYGKNWGMIAQHIEGKTGKQVRERYINKLDPTIKRTAWSEEEDQKILDMFLEQGAKWSAISNELIGRPENTVKNRFYSHISRIYLSEESAYLANKNNDNTQKVKDACAKLPHSQNVKKPIPRKPNSRGNHEEVGVEEENNDENEDDDEEEEEEEDEELDEEEENEEQIDEENHLDNSNNNNSARQQGQISQKSNYGENAQQEQIKKKGTSKEVGSRSVGIPTTQTGNISEPYGNVQANNDRKSLKIEEQDDQEEELMDGHLEQNCINLKQPAPAQCGFEPLIKNDEKTQDKQKSGLCLVANPMLAKRGKVIQNIEIPKANNQENMQNIQQNNINGNNNNNNNAVNQNNNRNIVNQISNSSNTNQISTNESDNAMTGIGMISNSNLDFMNNTPQPYFTNLALFNQQLTPLYAHQMHPQQFQQQQQQSQQQMQMQIQQQPVQTPLETASPMFVLANSINSPAPRSSLPLFKPPSSMGNTTPSAITPLMANNYGQYFVYNPNQSLGMLTPSPFPAYQHMFNPYMIKNQGSAVFSSLAKLGQNQLNNEVDKPTLDQTDNNNQNFLNLLNNQNNNTNNNNQNNYQIPFDQSQKQQQLQQQIAPSAALSTGANFPQKNIKQSAGVNSNGIEVYNNTGFNQPSPPQDIVRSQATDEKNPQCNQFIDSPLSTLQLGFPGMQHSNLALQTRQKNLLQRQEPAQKSQLDHLLQEFTNMDPEQKRKFQLMISGQQPDNTTKSDQQEQIQSTVAISASVKEENHRNSFASPQ